MESGLPKKAELIETFKTLSAKVGPERIVWRYSPILLSQTYTIGHHIKYFEEFAKRLEGFTNLCRISFLDIYKKIAFSMKSLGIYDVPEKSKRTLTQRLMEIGMAHGITIGGCGNMDLQAVGLAPIGCIDSQLVARVIGKGIQLQNDPGQRDG